MFLTFHLNFDYQYSQAPDFHFSPLPLLLHQFMRWVHPAKQREKRRERIEERRKRKRGGKEKATKKKREIKIKKNKEGQD